MLGWQEIVQQYIIKHADRIRKATRPLREHFGVGYFTYHRIDETGKYTVLVDRPDWAEHYVGEKIYLNDPYLRHPKVYESGVCLVQSHGSEEYRERVMKAGKEVLDMDTAVILIHKRDQVVEFFGFAGSQHTSCLERLHLNHAPLLKSFAAHFKKEMGRVLTQMEEEADSLLHLKGDDFLCEEPICPVIDSQSRLSYLTDLGLIRGGEVRLSRREKECLQCLLEGITAKETAAKMGLKPRTVESYFENMKNKLGCWNRGDLLQIGRALSDAGLLS